jgi:hypothetical protein
MATKKAAGNSCFSPDSFLFKKRTEQKNEAMGEICESHPRLAFGALYYICVCFMQIVLQKRYSTALGDMKQFDTLAIAPPSGELCCRHRHSYPFYLLRGNDSDWSSRCV